MALITVVVLGAMVASGLELVHWAWNVGPSPLQLLRDALDWAQGAASA